MTGKPGSGIRMFGASLALGAAFCMLVPSEAQAQGRRDRGGVSVSAEITLSVGTKERIREFYAARPAIDVDALPPGIRKRLARGKPLPPGIAKKVAPPELVGGLSLPSGYQLVEVGVDVLLVEVATGVIHDVLMDLIR